MILSPERQVTDYSPHHTKLRIKPIDKMKKDSKICQLTSAKIGAE
jgi:hypothetical protein